MLIGFDQENGLVAPNRKTAVCRFAPGGPGLLAFCGPAAQSSDGADRDACVC